MKYCIFFFICFFLCIVLCIGQNDTTQNNKGKKVATQTQNKKVNNKKRTAANKERTGINEGKMPVSMAADVLPDTLQSLNDSIAGLHQMINHLKSELDELQTDKEYLSEKVEDQKSTIRQLRNGKDPDPPQPFSFKLAAIVTAIGLMAILWLRSRKKRSSQTPVPVQMQPVNTMSTRQYTMQQPVNPGKQTRPLTTISTDVSDGQKSFSNIHYLPDKNNRWYIVGASSTGKSHITGNKPCQDNHYCVALKNGWGIAVVCDGAGTADNSHIGSEYISRMTCKIFGDLLLSKKYVEANKLPGDAEWQALTNVAFKNIYELLFDYAKKSRLEFTSLACTSIVVVFSPVGLLSAHIGDGRAGYCNEAGEWKPLIIPHKGEEANHTIFITSAPWLTTPDFSMSSVPVPESRVIKEKAIAFMLMSDGCETHSFECSKMDDQTNKWMDPNRPYEKFFHPLLHQLKGMAENKLPLTDANANWMKFLEGGNIGLKEESDDKTMIFGIIT